MRVLLSKPSNYLSQLGHCVPLMVRYPRERLEQCRLQPVSNIFVMPEVLEMFHQSVFPAEIWNDVGIAQIELALGPAILRVAYTGKSMPVWRLGVHIR